MATSGSAPRRRPLGHAGSGSTGRATGPRACQPLVTVAAWPDRVAQAALPVVAGPQGRIAQPVVRDIDPLGHLEALVTRDVGVVASEQAAPGDLDRFDAGVERDAEAGIQVVAGQRRSWHRDHRRHSHARWRAAMLREPAGVGSGALEGGCVSFIKRAAEQAQQAAEAARVMAGDASRSANDPATQERLGKQAREAVGMARRGISTVVERIDPGTLAELIIKATALQEMTNNALRQKGSPYRISEISIAASIPPGISFAISRIDDGQRDDHRRGRLVRRARGRAARRGRGGHRARRHDARRRADRRRPRRARPRTCPTSSPGL